MASTKVTFKRGLKSDINSVPIKDGQLIVTKDTGELYADVPLNGQIVRRLVGDGAGIVDLTYDPTSTNAQSGKAVAGAVAPKANSADLANVATSGDYGDLIDKPFEKGEGNTSVQQMIDAEGGQPVALGKWSLAEGRGNNLTVKLVSKDLANNKISVAKYNGDTQVNGARDIRANAILWIDGAWYYVTAVSKTNPVNILTLDAVERQLKDQDGHDTTVHQLANIDIGTEIHAYMGAAAASASHIEGNFNNTVWLHSRYEKNEDNVNRSHAEGSRTLATGYCAHVEGENSKALGSHTHVEGKDCEASGASAHSEGTGSKASGYCAHAEGENTTASGVNSHAEGGGCTASGGGSHAGGYGSIADGDKAFAHGFYVNASTSVETPGKAAFGQYNENDPNNIFEVGNGNSSDRRNAFSVDYHGNAASGYKPIKRAAYRAVKTFTPSQTLSGGQMLIRIGQYASGGTMSTIYNPRLRNVTTGEEINIAITDNNIVVNSSSTANLKWDLRGGNDNHNGINILSTTIDNYKVFEVNAKIDGAYQGWRYLQYCINDMTFNAENTYELSVLSPYAVISEIATLDIYYELIQQTTDPIVVEGGALHKFSVGNSTSANNTNAFEICLDGSGKIQTQGTDPDSIVQKQYVDSKQMTIKSTLDNTLIPNTQYDLGTIEGDLILSLPTTSINSCDEIYVAFIPDATLFGNLIITNCSGLDNYQPTNAYVIELHFKYICGYWIGKVVETFVGGQQ